MMYPLTLIMSLNATGTCQSGRAFGVGMSTNTKRHTRVGVHGVWAWGVGVGCGRGVVWGGMGGVEKGHEGEGEGMKVI